MPCECRTDRRSFVVLSPELDEIPELQVLAGTGGATAHAQLGAVVVEMGGGNAWNSAAEVVRFLEAILPPERFAALRCAWVRRGEPLEAQFRTLIHARPLREVMGADSSPLPGILREGALETWYQPVFRAGDLELWGYECLLRARDAAGALVPPSTLFAWARQENLTFVLDRAAREAHLANAGRAAIPPGATLLVNFLPTAIYTPEFCLRTTVKAAEAAGLAPERVVFEVVETEAVGDREHLRSILAYYRERGFRVALDDVASGYSGLTLLADLAPDLVKIDRELVSRAPASTLHREICAALVRLGHTHGLQVLAEGVETEEQWRAMDGLGVDLLQGYLFGRPQPEPATAAAVARLTRG